MIANVKALRKEPKRFYCDSGSPERSLYVMDGDHLAEAGIENSQALINSYADSCDLNLIIEKVTQGEVDLLMKRTGVFIDTTQFPTMVCDLKNQIRENMAAFDALPDDIKVELGSYAKLGQMSDNKFKEFIENHKYVEPIDDYIPVPSDPEMEVK